MKSFRDPVHNLIVFQNEDQIVVDLVNTREVQRLRRIRQLGLGNIAYPGAEHSRFVHSLGVAHLMRRFLDDLREGADEQTNRLQRDLQNYRVLALASALLHDIGHGPFSHALESVTKIRHERFTSAILRSHMTEVHQVLESFEEGLSARVASVIERTFEPSRALVKLLSSQLDLDRVDYLLRDALMTGAGYGTFDVEWLLHAMRIGEVDGEPEVGLDLKKGQSIAEDYIMCRYYMYLHVYFHRTTRAAEVMVEKLLQRAAEVRAFLPGFDGLNALLQGQIDPNDSTSLTLYLQLDDGVLWTAMHFWSRHEDVILRDFSQRLLHRKIFRGIEVESEEEAQNVRSKQCKQAIARGMDPEYYVIDDQAASHAYSDPYLAPPISEQVKEPAKVRSAEASESIYLFDEEGRPHELSEASFLVYAVRNRSVYARRVLFPEEWA
ncbi:HD domain-containing protein [Sulfoacidibacillus thermotolerans]|uniref:HD/PDEase domain-containing protein n=1 Tax=Sulfoacidibacillus thermotolerans TaxID=1765684 RepID=A0A2U3D9K0_SULT2|nr:HD domain-containing protein [Sulfoacidibacillus thermotolerans]PWI57942.1 hypothetical protein BM613_05895 [Sulfoacidibacillus thermotolerans]